MLVVPPETEPIAVAWLMTAAAVPGCLLTASALMADEAMSHDATKARNREEEWETDGGAASAADRDRAPEFRPEEVRTWRQPSPSP